MYISICISVYMHVCVCESMRVMVVYVVSPYIYIETLGVYLSYYAPLLRITKYSYTMETLGVYLSYFTTESH